MGRPGAAHPPIKGFPLAMQSDTAVSWAPRPRGASSLQDQLFRRHAVLRAARAGAARRRHPRADRRRLARLGTFGFGFLYTQVWNPVTEKFGALAPIYGTLVTSVLAMLLGVPVSFGIAMFITELCPPWLKRPLGIAIELLAGIPSIIYGIWGLFVLAPFLQQTVQPFLIGTLGKLPLIGKLFAGPPYGIGIFTAAIILGIMVLPFITSITRDVFETVPPMLKESAYGLGATTWEVVWKVVLPYSRVGVIGAVMLGLGRALGETMAVTFVIGNAHRIASSILAPGTTISAVIANEFTEAVGDLYTSSLIALGLILFVITFFILAAAKLMLMRMQRQEDRRGGSMLYAAAATNNACADDRHGGRRVRPVLADRDPVDADLQRRQRDQPQHLHRDDAAARQRRGPAERHLRQPGADDRRHADRHADRHDGRHISRRIRQDGRPGPNRPLHQRHPAERPVDRRRPVHL